MELLLNHWHCILPALAALAALFVMDRREKRPDRKNSERQE